MNAAEFSVYGESLCQWPNHQRAPRRLRRRSWRDVPQVERDVIVGKVLAGGGYERVGVAHRLCKAYVQKLMDLADARCGRSISQRKRAA